MNENSEKQWTLLNQLISKSARSAREAGKIVGDLVNALGKEKAYKELLKVKPNRGVAFFVKQLGSNSVENGRSLSLAHTHGGDWDEWPTTCEYANFHFPFIAGKHHDPMGQPYLVQLSIKEIGK